MNCPAAVPATTALVIENLSELAAAGFTHVCGICWAEDAVRDPDGQRG